MPYLAATAGFSSTLSLTTWILSACSPAISSRMGETWRHGPHHSAQKSTSTALSLCRTSVVKLSSVTVFAVVPTEGSFRFDRSVWAGKIGQLGGPGAGRRSGVDVDGLEGLERVSGELGVLERGEVALRVERGGASGAGCGDGLSVDVVDDIPTGEDAGH